KDHPHPVFTRRGQRKAQVRTFPVEKRVGNLNQDTRAVAGFRIAAASAAMRQVYQDLYAFEDDIVRLAPFDVHDESDAATVVLVLRVVKALRRWQPRRWEMLRHYYCPCALPTLPILAFS